MTLLLLSLACESDDTETGDTGGSGDTSADTGTPDTDTDTGSDTSRDSGETGETGGAVTPEYVFVAGPTAIQLDFTSTGSAGASDVVRYGLWQNADMDGFPGATGELAAEFPSSIVVEVAAGLWYCGTFLDLGGDNATGPGAEDITARWENEGDIAYGIEVRDGFTTQGVTLAFVVP